MNRVQIKINPYAGIHVISLNGNPLPVYSELNNFMQEPFLTWAPKILEAIDRELNDDYQLEIVSEKFEAFLMEAFQKDDEECLSVTQKPFLLPMCVAERKKEVERLAEKYLQEDLQKQKNRLFFVEENLQEEVSVQGTDENAFVVITNNRKKANTYLEEKATQFVIVLADKESIQMKNGGFLWELPKEKLSQVVEAIKERFELIPEILEKVQLLHKYQEAMSEEELQDLRLVTEVDPVCLVEAMQPIEVGEEAAIRYKVIPESETLPKLRCVVESDSILECREMCLRGISKGKTSISFYQGEAVIPFQTMQVEVYEKHLAQKLELSVKQTVMEAGKTQQISVSVTPKDAEDIPRFRWSVSDSEIAQVDSYGNIHALKEGTCVVTLQGEATSAEISLQVKPCAERIELSKKQIQCYVGEEKEIRAKVLPENCYSSEYQWFTTDSQVAVVDRKQDGTETVWAKGIGSCQVICRTTDGSVEALCQVLVESTFKKAEETAPWLKLCGVLFVLYFLFLFNGFAIGVYGSIIGMWITGILAIKAKKTEWFWALILMILPILLLFSA